MSQTNSHDCPGANKLKTEFTTTWSSRQVEFAKQNALLRDVGLQMISTVKDTFNLQVSVEILGKPPWLMHMCSQACRISAVYVEVLSERYTKLSDSCNRITVLIPTVRDYDRRGFVTSRCYGVRLSLDSWCTSRQEAGDNGSSQFSCSWSPDPSSTAYFAIHAETHADPDNFSSRRRSRRSWPANILLELGASVTSGACSCACRDPGVPTSQGRHSSERISHRKNSRLVSSCSASTAKFAAPAMDHVVARSTSAFCIDVDTAL